VEDPRVAPSPQDCGYYPVPPGKKNIFKFEIREVDEILLDETSP
jgi:hypothetical protein